MQDSMGDVDKDGARHPRTYGNPEHLADRHEPNACRDLAGSDFHLSHRETSLTIAAYTDTDEDCVSVHLGVGCILIYRVCE